MIPTGASARGNVWLKPVASLCDLCENRIERRK